MGVGIALGAAGAGVAFNNGGCDRITANVEGKGGQIMSRSLNERETGNKATVARRPAVAPVSRQERQLELESRLRIAEADARWQRRKDMILVGSLAYVVLGSFTVWAVVLLSGAYPSAEKQLITGFIVQLLINLFLVVAGKKLRWKEGAE